MVLNAPDATALRNSHRGKGHSLATACAIPDTTLCVAPASCRFVVFPNKGASAHCYEFTAEVKNGRIVTRDDVPDKSAKLGSEHKLTVTAFGDDGDRSNDVSDVTTFKVIAKSARVAARERIGC